MRLTRVVYRCREIYIYFHMYNRLNIHSYRLYYHVLDTAVFDGLKFRSFISRRIDILHI